MNGDPKKDYQKTPTKGPKINKYCGLLRWKSAKCHIKCNTYKTNDFLELYDKLNHSQQGREKVKELKERNYRTVFRNRLE